MKKRIIAILMVLAMVLSMVGCNSKDNTADSSANINTKVKTDEGANTLTVWCWNPAFNITALEQAAEIYKQDHPDFVLNVVETPWPDIQTKLITAASSGNLNTLPDIFLMQDNAFQKNVISFPDLFTEITSAGIDFKQFSSAKVGYSVVDGKNYGVPFDNGAVIACYRTDILEDAGYTAADFNDITWSKYIEMGKIILEKTGKPLLSCTAGGSDLIMMMLQSAGSSLFDAEGNPSIVDNAILKQVMETYAALVVSGILVEVDDWDEYVGSFTNSTVAGTINGCWIMASIQTAVDQSGKWAITNMPSLDGIDGATNYSNNGGSSWAITSQNKTLAEDFMASTFAGSVEFYEKILPSTGALATYLPAADSDVYEAPQKFFGDAKVFSLITAFAGKVPSNNTGIYYYEACDAIATAVTNIVAGADVDTELKSAQEEVKLAMSN